MYQHQKEFLKVAQGYNQQIGLLMDIAARSNRKQTKRLMPILQKLKSSFQKLVDQQDQYKQSVFNLQKSKTILQPHIDLLVETKAEIERLNNEPKH